MFYEVERIDGMFVKRFMKKANLNYREIKKRLALYFMVRALIYSNFYVKAFCLSLSSVYHLRKV